MSDPVTIRSPRIYAGVLSVTLLTIAVGAWGGTSLGPWAVAVLFVAVVATGMPHGAIDHLVAARLWGLEALTVAVLAALFGLVHPLVAFSVYFGGWHALGHIPELLRFFRRRGEAMSMGRFYREAFLFTLLPFVGLAGLYAATQSVGPENQLIVLLFILIAIMTLPHMVVVEKLYREREKSAPKAFS